MKKIGIYFLLFTIISCQKPLDLTPRYGFNSDELYNDANNYIHVLSKLYAGLSLTGNSGPAGDADLPQEYVLDEGFSSYVRVLWNLQELPTDEAVCGWLNDGGIQELDKLQWGSSEPWSVGMYYRIYFQITLCNEFIFQTQRSLLTERGFTQADVDRISNYRNEARFLRALSYYHALDIFGNVPFVTENDRVGSNKPTRIDRINLFNYVVSELLDLENLLFDPSSLEYGRASKQAAQTLLAKLYLNAEVYTGIANFNECITYCEKVINSNSFQLDDNYQDLFLADNNTSPEIIFPVVFDGQYSQTWGGTTFLVCASIGGNMSASDYGVNGGWGGLRVRENLVNKFSYNKQYIFIDSTNASNPDTVFSQTLISDTNFILIDSIYQSDDQRFLFFTEGQYLEISNIGNFRHGFAFPKFKNINSTGSVGSNNGSSAHVDIDFPMFRLADVYLMLAESSLRIGDQGTAMQYVNLIRERAHGNSLNNLSTLTLDDILDERSRELSWEATRRTDLIRFGYFTSSNYLWPFKGGDINGVETEDHLRLYPIPYSDLLLNDNLVQNDGY